LKIRDRKADVRRYTSSELDYLLDHFTVEQIHDLSAAAAPKRTLPKSKDKAALIRNLKKLTDIQRLTLAAHRLEALLPFKHVYVYRFSRNGAHAGLADQVASRFGPALESYHPVDLSNIDLQTQCAIIDRNRDRIYVKLCHGVDHYEWLELAEDRRERYQYRQRHPVVIQFHCSDLVATVSFPGFTQGSATPDAARISYSDLCSKAVALVAENTDASFEGARLKPSVDALINEEHSEVIDVRRSINSASGSANFRALEGGVDVATLLSKMFGMRISASEIRLLLSNEEATDIALFWQKLGLYTRIRLTGEAPELLFIWKQSGASSLVEYVLNRLLAARQLGTSENDIRKFLEAMPLGEKIRTSALIQRFDIPEAIALKLISASIAARVLEPRFRIQTDALLMGYQNEWRPLLTDIPAAVQDEDGNEIEVSSPKNIEVSYERIVGER
jgi:hypothetical protein